MNKKQKITFKLSNQNGKLAQDLEDLIQYKKKKKKVILKTPIKAKI